jgi:NADPH-dependent glutamate synthase beta subunit-like oxidoreductase
MEKETALQRLSQIHGEKCWPSVDKVSPCEKACPIRTDVPSYVIAIAQGKFKEALEIIRETNPFPSICGRVCHHPCEAECNRALLDEPIAIRDLKRFVADFVMEDNSRVAPIQRTKKERVAVIGSGPAGLTAAYDLVREGYGVTVYEALPVAGGMLYAGIPEFILPREVIEKEIGYIRDLGVEIKVNIQIGRDLALEDLWKKGYKAILLATGAQKTVLLPIPGSDLKNVSYALPLLKQVNLGGKVPLRGKVLVVGGGGVAIDAARVIKRLNADEVHLACLESRKDMPADSWVIEAAEREGVRVHTSLAPQRFAENGGKRIKVEFRRVASTQVDSEGRISWTLMEGAGSEYAMAVDRVVVAIGQVPDSSYVGGNGLKVSKRGTFVVDAQTLAATRPGVFVAGDAGMMEGTVTDAMASGQKAAQSIHRYLQGKDLAGGFVNPEKEVLKIDPQMVAPWLIHKGRWAMPALSPKDAVRTFEEVEVGYTRAAAVEEAKRCLNCRMCANCIYGRNQICFETGIRLL